MQEKTVWQVKKRKCCQWLNSSTASGTPEGIINHSLVSNEICYCLRPCLPWCCHPNLPDSLMKPCGFMRNHASVMITLNYVKHHFQIKVHNFFCHHFFCHFYNDFVLFQGSEMAYRNYDVPVFSVTDKDEFGTLINVSI